MGVLKFDCEGKNGNPSGHNALYQFLNNRFCYKRCNFLEVCSSDRRFYATTHDESAI